MNLILNSFYLLIYVKMELYIPQDESYLEPSLYQDESYPGKLPEELIYVMCTYLKSACNLEERIKSVYTKYINDINKGYVDNFFRTENLMNFKLYEDKFHRFDYSLTSIPTDKANHRGLWSILNQQWSISWHKGIFDIKTDIIEMKITPEDYDLNSINKVIFFQCAHADNFIIFINKKGYYVVSDRRLSMSRVGMDISIIYSKNWKFIWDNLSGDIKFKLLIQSGY